MKIFRWVSLSLILLLLPMGILVGTEWGLQFVVTAVQSVSGGAVTVGSVSGRLATAYNLNSVTISTSGADVDIDSFDWSWKPLALFTGELNIVACIAESITVHLKPSEPRERDSSSFRLPRILPPVKIILQKFFLRDVKILDSTTGNLAFQLDSFMTSLELGGGELMVHQFVADAPALGLDFQGAISLEKEYNIELAGNWRLAGYGFHPSKGRFSADGPIETLGVHVSLSDPGEIHVVGIIKDLFDNPTWVADVDARNVNLQTWILHCPDIMLETVHADKMSGDFGHYRGLVVAEGYWGIADKLQLRSEIDGDAWGIVFNSLRLDRNDTSAVATNASISWEKLFSWEADLDFSNFVLSMFFPDLDASVSSSFHSIGGVTEEGLDASFALKTMDGRVTDYLWSVSGNIGLTEERIFSDDLVIKSDSVGGEALVRYIELSWADNLSWKSDFDLHQFDPGFLHPELFGKVSGHMNSELTWKNDLPVGTLDIEKLSGELRGSELSGGGSIAIDGSVFSSPGLELLLGESRFFVSGAVNEVYGLEFSFESPDLSQVASRLGGSLNVSGQVMGSKTEPHFDIQFNGRDVLADSVTIGEISGALTTDLAEDGRIVGTISAADSVFNGYDLSRFDLRVDGTMLSHQGHAEVGGSAGDMRLDVSGSYDKGWKGVVSTLALETVKYGHWQQLDQAAVAVSSEQLSVENFCFTNSAAGSTGRACVKTKFDLNKELDWSVAADIASFEVKPLAEMDLGIPPVSGELNATLEAKGDRRGVGSAYASVDMAEFATLLHVTGEDYVSVQLKDSTMDANLQDGNLALNLYLKSNRGGSLALSGSITEFGQFATPLDESLLSGALTLDKYHLDSLAAFTGFGIEPTGWVSSSLRIEGSLAQPELYGKVEIQEGGLELPYQGISLENVVFAVHSGESGALVRASASSGGGQIEINGAVSHGDDGLEAALKLTGENFLLVNLPEYSFRVTPDASVTFSKNRVQIGGMVTVPSGLIAPEEMSEAVKVSEDVVYLGEEKAHDKKSYPFDLSLDVLLGDKVEVDGYGLKGRLGGKLHVKVTPADFITGTGELDLLDSTFTFYGRSLDIERGRMFFTGGPIDNPGVDIRAQKIISPETALDDGYTVGVDINGLVQDLQFRLYSDPFMEDTDILSQMVVGHSFASSSQEEGTMLQSAAMTLGLEGSSKLMKGVGNLLLIDDLHLEGSTKDEDVSLVVGKRITEDLYIGYDMNMFSQLGQFRVRYDLSRGFYVETRSSSESTGADLIYTFER